MKKNKPNEIIERFNNLYPVGSKVQYRTVSMNGFPFKEGTVRDAAYINEGNPVAFLEEVRGFLCITPDFIKYPDEDLDKNVNRQFLLNGQKFYFLSRGYVEETNDDCTYIVLRYESDTSKGTYSYIIELGATLYGERTFPMILKQLNRLIKHFDLVQIETDFESYSKMKS